MNELLERAQPLLQAELRYNQDLEDIEQARLTGLIKQAQILDLQADAAHRLQVIQDAHAAGGGRLNRADLTNLSYQANDIVTMLASGSSPFQVLATQGPQIYQTIAGARGGLTEGFKALGGAIRSVMSPTVVLGGLLTGTAAAAILAWNRYDESIKGVEKSLIGLGRSTQASASQLAGLAEGAAGAAGLSNVEARSGVGALAGTGRISTDVMGDALAVGKDLAILTGQDLPDAMGDLASKLADPARGVEELDKQFNLFTVTQRKAIQRMAETGDRAGAQRAIVDRLTQVVGEASDKNSIWARSWDAVATAASNAVDAVGKAVDRAVGPEPRGSPQGGAAGSQGHRGAPEHRLGEPSSCDCPGPEWRCRSARGHPGARVQSAGGGAPAEPLAHQRAKQAQVQNLSRDMAAIYQGTTPVNDAITKLRQNIEALANAMAGGEFKLLPEDEQRRIREAAELLGRMNEAEQLAIARLAARANTSAGAWRPAFSVETSTMTDLERSIAEINEQYRVQVEQARASKESAEATGRGRGLRSSSRCATISWKPCAGRRPWAWRAASCPRCSNAARSRSSCARSGRRILQISA